MPVDVRQVPVSLFRGVDITNFVLDLSNAVVYSVLKDERRVIFGLWRDILLSTLVDRI